MKCKNCGTFNEDYMEYCENCAAPLVPENEEPASQQFVPESDDTASGTEAQASWGFVQAPRWIRPEFDANTISEDDIPADFTARRHPAAAPVQAAPVQSSGTYEAPMYGGASQGSYNAAPVNSAQTYNAAPTGNAAVYNAPTYSAPTYNAPAYSAPAYNAPAYGGAQQAPAYEAPKSGNYQNAPTFTAQPYGGAPSTYAQQGAQSGVKFAEPLDDDYFSSDPSIGEPRRRSAKRSESPRDMKTLFFWIAAGVLVVLIVVFSIIFFKNRADKDKPSDKPEAPAASVSEEPSSSKNKPAFLGGLFSKNPITKPATIEEGVTADGEPAYIITIYAKNKSTVRFTAGSLVKENPITDGSLKLRIPKEIWIPDEPVESTSLEIYPDIVVLDKEGKEFPVEFDAPIMIDLPSIDLTLSDPTTATVTTANGSINVAGMVGDTTAEVFVNDTQLYLDESGNFAGSYTVSGYGSFEVNVEARKNGYQIARKTFSVEYPDPATGAAAPATIDPSAPAAPAAPAASGAIPSNATAVAYVSTDDLNVRDQAAQSGNAIGKLPLCTKIYIIMEDAGNGWAKIIYNNAEAYASAQYLRVVASAADYRTTTATVNTDNLKLRSTSSTSGEILTQLAKDSKINYIKDAGSDWSMVEVNGLIGFVATQYITK